MFERTPDYGETYYDYYTEKPNDLKPLKSLDGWKIADGTTDIRGMSIVDRDGKDLGKIDDLLMSMSAHEAVFGIVSLTKDFDLGGKHTLIPLDRLHFDKDNKRVFFDGMVDHLRDVPEYKKDIHDYSGFYNHWSGVRSNVGYSPGYEKQEFRRYVTYPSDLEEEDEVIEEERTHRGMGGV